VINFVILEQSNTEQLIKNNESLLLEKYNLSIILQVE